MKVIRKAGATSNILQIFIADSSSTTGAGLTGLVFNTASLTAYYHKDTDTTATAITLVTMTVGTFTSSGFKEIDATNMPGWYQFCPPDAAFTSAKSAGFHLKGATNMAPLPIEIDLDAQADVTHWNGTAVSSPATAGIPDVNVKNIDNDAASASGTVTFPNATLASTTNITAATGVDITKILGAAISAPATAGILDVNVKNINNVAAATPGASGGILISGSNSGTTTLGALICTGSFTISDGLIVSRSSANSSAFTATGTGSGAGVVLTGGATGIGCSFVGGGTSGEGIKVNTTAGIGINCLSANTHAAMFSGQTSGAGIRCQGGAAGAGIQASSQGTGAGMLIVGGNASGSTAAGVGISIAGGAASTSGGGTAGAGISVIGGAGAASTNGSAAGTTSTAGGTTTVAGNDGMVITGTSNGNGLTLVHAGTGKDFNATTTPLILAKTTNITGFNDPTTTQNADALLNRDMSAVSDTTARSPLNALRAIRNKVSIAAGTVTVTKEDDTTSAWTGAVTTDATAAPIIAVDPA